GRPPELPGVDAIMGMLINTLPVRVRLDPQASLLSCLQQLQAEQDELRQHEHTPLMQVQGWSEVPRGTSLFDTLLSFENYPMDSALGGADYIERTHYPLAASVIPNPKGVLLKLAFESDRFEGAIVDQLLAHWGLALERMVEAQPEQPLARLSLLTEGERRQVLEEWNGARIPALPEVCAHQLFEAQVQRTPGAVAVSFEGAQLTYAELDRRANQLAHHLRSLGVGLESRVGLCVERSLELVVGILGTLKAGGAYVPLDPALPAERLAFMMADSGLTVLLTQERLVSGLPEHGARVVRLDSDWAQIARWSEAPPASGSSSENLAYVIYTSGSTGKPKGTLLAHRGLCNTARAAIEAMGIGPDSRVLQFSSLGFDASVWEIFSALLAGARLVLASREALMPGAPLQTLLKEQAVTTATLTPSVLMQLEAASLLPTLETVAAVGEACTPELVARWKPGRKFLNAYGPTEVTICATQSSEVEPRRPTIGRPLPNVQVYVLDEGMQPVPVGVPGELCVGGVGLARGYLGRPELTAARFVPHPFSAEPGARLYRTGDVARWLADGELEFLGRADDQVKVRGFRIELGEVEAALAQHPAVREAVVVVRESAPGVNQLVGYIVTQGEERPSKADLRTYLRERLPEYMVPSALVLLEALPLTPNGKVDRRALPAPELGAKGTEDFVAPRGAIEEMVAGIWAQVLGLEKVSANGNFFELGGHSLVAMRVLSRVRETFKVEWPVRSLFGAPTVVGLARSIESVLEGEQSRMAPPLVPVPREGAMPTSFAQQRLWFLEQLQPGGSTYNVPMAMHLRGRLGVAALERSLRELIQRHEALRTTFASPEGRVVQVISPEVGLELEVEDLEGLVPPEREEEARRRTLEEAQRPFELSRGPLLRAKVLRLGREEHVLVLVMHHIVTDGWSVDVLLRALGELYAAFEAGEEPALPELGLQYADYAVWQRQWLRGEVLEAQLAYWKKTLAGAPQALELPTDRARPQVQTYRGAQVKVQLPLALSKEVRALSQREGATLFMTLLGALQALLARYSGQTDIVVGSPIAGRNRQEVEGLIGFFINTLALRADVQGTQSFKQMLAQVREVCLGAYAHQELPFEQVVDALQLERDLSRTPLFQVMFILEDEPVRTVQLGGLSLKPLEVEFVPTKFDLTVGLRETGQGLLSVWEYNTELFNRETVARMAGHFQKLLEGVVARPEQRVEELQLLTEEERRRVLEEWNDTRAEYPRERCVHELFEEQVERTPEAVALEYEGTQLTYRELNRRANLLARRLVRIGVGPEVRVGLCLERSVEMVVALLGTLKAGGAYVPLEPSYPRERLAYMMEDARAPVVLTKERWLETLPEQTGQVVCLDSGWGDIEREGGGEENVRGGARADNLIYVIYTSGSTGRPKGAMNIHSALSNRLLWMQ
ncbi:amino acid adenylation domain-containing protein, partial [Archangium sp.]|uniref:amino acid adenylation domain-containing protein n=1 Tax=Archangium sp. TaxID=1872627 RepID=UPI002D4AA520